MDKKIINKFNGKYYFLSNFFTCNVRYEGVTYHSAECAFQAAKTEDKELRLEFAKMTSAVAKHRGRKVNLRNDWQYVKQNIMHDVLVAKFTQNPTLKTWLLNTGDAILIEGNTWGDTYWGYDTKLNEGENHLGKLLMQVREELK